MFRLLLVVLLLAGCAARLPPPPEDAIAKRFEAISDRAVIYLARHPLDRDFVAQVLFDGEMLGSTYRGTYMRIEAPPGPHEIRGYAGDGGTIKINTAAGQIYFVQQTTNGYRSFTSSHFGLVDASYGRSMVTNGEITLLIRR